MAICWEVSWPGFNHASLRDPLLNLPAKLTWQMSQCEGRAPPSIKSNRCLVKAAFGSFADTGVCCKGTANERRIQKHRRHEEHWKGAQWKPKCLPNAGKRRAGRQGAGCDAGRPHAPPSRGTHVRLCRVGKEEVTQRGHECRAEPRKTGCGTRNCDFGKCHERRDSVAAGNAGPHVGRQGRAWANKRTACMPWPLCPSPKERDRGQSRGGPGRTPPKDGFACGDLHVAEQPWGRQA